MAHGILMAQQATIPIILEEDEHVSGKRNRISYAPVY